MGTTFKALAAISILASAVSLATQAAAAENTTPPATATRPAAPDQSSVPSAAPPASRTETTGQSAQDPKIKEMNERERSKVEREGK